MSSNRSSIELGESYAFEESDVKYDGNDDDDAINSARVYADTEQDIQSYRFFFMIHAIFCEGPGAIIEGLFRLIALLFIILILFLLGLISCRSKFLHQGLGFIREFLITLVAVFSLIAPGMVLFVYSNFDAELEWDLKPIPTLLGWVDARRFAVITFGQGEFAGNINYNDRSVCQDSWIGPILLSPRSLWSSYLASAYPKERISYSITDA